MSDKSSYRSIFKSTSLFGGVQVFNIIITIIRGKFVAVLLGPAGMGINGLFMTTIQMLQNITNLGLPQSAVRDIASSSNDPGKIAVTYTVFKRWIWFTALLGGSLTFFGAPFLSQYVFQNDSYAWAFRLLSVTFVFGAVSGGIYTLLRGLRRLKALASANVLGSLAGLLVAVPLFYFFGIQGIVPAILATAMANFGIALFFKNREVKIESANLNYKRTFFQGLDMAKLGISLSASMLMTSGISFVLLTFINRQGSEADVGLYNAGLTITNTYVGLVFTALATDYFPRLAEKINLKTEEWKQVVHQQLELMLLILAPLLVVLILTAPVFIKLLLSEQFLSVIPYLLWAVVGVFLKAPVWVLGYIFIASGNNRVFLVTEASAALIQLALNIFFYQQYGLEGLGVALGCSYLLSFCTLLVVMKWIYGFSFNSSQWKIVLILFVLVLGSALSAKYLNYPMAYLSGGFFLILVGWFSLQKLNQLMDIRGAIQNVATRFRKR
ncbi:O-antigen translocase [uncultured Imperialibacter sp.]|uniref:O-antigen translocase n=1 Tax=uncultured Imperialibacter sp. TaxID=1672639 RepID=UPI0030DD5B8A|tara:strand:+ start:948 stop:2435 length:1488 start_codon:yes stop_codon:yes gene_type:complete